ncbi:endonuclease domain-containing protein [Nocardia inohanensis]|uniref:endonuclease domain-containing protein n=1 Tax=Nocardia inohanensis TaxID=209246 RepID=UPI000AEA4C04|nr:DUF559 domain-containing protein [Nocardia inohanensis]
MTLWELRHDYERIFPDVYVRKGISLDAAGRARAAAHWAKGAAIITGHSAAAMHGTRWLDPTRPAELAHPNRLKPPAGISAVRDTIPPHETCDIDGFRVTTPARTAFDIGRRTPRDQAIPVLDSLCAATGLHPNEISSLTRHHIGARGIRHLTSLIPLIDGSAESPPESTTRLLLIDSGFPTPTTQFVIRDPSGNFIARVDMAWEPWRVAVEYDGAHHWTDKSQRTRDIDRYALLESLGWRVIRVGADLLRNRPHIIVDRAHSALRAAGAHLDA